MRSLEWVTSFVSYNASNRPPNHEKQGMENLDIFITKVTVVQYGKGTGYWGKLNGRKTSMEYTVKEKRI